MTRTVDRLTGEPGGGGGRPGVSEAYGPRQVVRRLGAALATYYSRGARIDRACYLLAVALLASGIAHLGVQLLLGGPWDGPVSWRKPVTFGLAFGLTLATVTWVTTFLPLRPRVRERLLVVFATACAVEVVVITTQAWRGVPSHFNVSTPLDAGFAYTAAAGGAAIVATTLAFARASTRPNPAVPPSMRLAIRVGVATFVVALLIGAVMIAMGVRETRTVSQTAAYTVATALKSGHAATMHGILVLPLLAWAASFAPWPETRRLRIVAVACAGYALGAAVVVVASFLGAVGGTGAGVVAWFIVGTGALCLLVAVAAVLAGLATPSAEPGLEHRGSAAHRTAAAGWMTPRSDRRREE